MTFLCPTSDSFLLWITFPLFKLFNDASLEIKVFLMTIIIDNRLHLTIDSISLSIVVLILLEQLHACFGCFFCVSHLNSVLCATIFLPEL